LGFAVGWLRGLAARVDEVDVITMRRGRALLPSNVTIHSLGKERGASEPRRLATFYSELLQILAHRRPDAVFAHMTPTFAAMAFPFLRARDIPLTLWYAHAKGTSWKLRAAARAADTIVTPSMESFPLQSDRVVITGHGIDTDRFSPSSRGTVRRDEQSYTPRVISVGRVAPVKRLDVLIEAAARLGSVEGLSVEIVGPVLPGDEGYARRLRTMIDELSDGPSVSLMPPPTPDDLVSVYRSADVAVNVSDTDSVDKAGLEAMATEVPLVTSNRSLAAIVSAVDPQCVVAKGDPLALAEGLMRVLTMDSRSRAGLGVALRDVVVRDHSLDRLLDLLVTQVLFRPRQRH
jgi:glycosyltransferase involved in cell wall biosynthesis